MNATKDLISAEAVSATILLALSNARQRGDPWKTFAEEHLGWVEVLLNRVTKLSMVTFKEISLVTLDAEAMDQKVLQLLEQLAEVIWQVREQNPQDPLVAILSPGTPSFFFDWRVGHANDRVEALVEFIEPLLAESGEGQLEIVQIRQLLPEYRGVHDKVRALRCKLGAFEKLFENVTRLGHVQYSRLRRRMRAEGFEPFDVRKVFPDIPGGTMTGTLG